MMRKSNIIEEFGGNKVCELSHLMSVLPRRRASGVWQTRQVSLSLLFSRSGETVSRQNWAGNFLLCLAQGQDLCLVFRQFSCLNSGPDLTPFWCSAGLVALISRSWLDATRCAQEWYHIFPAQSIQRQKHTCRQSGLFCSGWNHCRAFSSCCKPLAGWDHPRGCHADRHIQEARKRQGLNSMSALNSPKIACKLLVYLLSETLHHCQTS